MVTVEAFNDKKLINIRVVGVENDFYITKSDFDKFEEAIGDYDNDLLLDGHWYRFALKPMYEDDGSGAMRLDWYDITSVVWLQ